MGSAQVKARPVFVAFWILASTAPVFLGDATGDRARWVVSSPYLVVVALAIGVMQGLVLEWFFGGAIFWRWLVVTVPFVIAAPYAGVLVGVLFLYYPVFAVVALLDLLHLGVAMNSSVASFVLVAGGLAAGGIPLVVAQWLVLRTHVGRRWLWTIPVPGLTYGAAFLFSRDNWGLVETIDAGGLLLGAALALVYAIATAVVIATAIPVRPATVAQA